MQVIAQIVLFVIAAATVGTCWAAACQTPGAGDATSAEVVAIDALADDLARFEDDNPHASVFVVHVSPAEGPGPVWKLFRDERSYEQAADRSGGFETAVVWYRGARVVAVSRTASSPAGHWMHFIDYVYRPDGSLARLDSHLNTTYGRVSVLRRRYFDRSGREIAESREVRDLDTQKVLSEEPGFMDDAIPVYLTTASFPFGAVLPATQPN